MSNDNLAQSDSIHHTDTENTKKRRFKWAKLQPFAIVFGIGLLGIILYKVGFSTVVETISRIGWGFLAVIFLNALRHLLKALSLYLSVPSGYDNFNFWDALSTRLAGESVGVLTFTGVMASETTKTALLKKKLTLSGSLATVVVDNLLYDVSVIIFILSGAFLMYQTFDGSNRALTAVLIFVVLLNLFTLIGFILMCAYRFKTMTYFLKHHGHKSWFPKFLVRRKNYLTELENDIFRFYDHHRIKFYSLIGINMLVHFLCVVEVYVAFYLLGFTPYATTSYIIESLTKIINFAFSFIPGNLGVYEGGSAVIFLALGYTGAAGVALALVRRGGILFWTFFGLLILMGRSFSRVLRKDKSKTV